MKMRFYFYLFSIICTLLSPIYSVIAQSQEVRMFAHRGGRMETDENTLQAFEYSYQLGYKGYEIDIRMTSDGELVLMHDSRLERTTNGKGMVEQKTRAELEKLLTKKGNPILFLDDFLKFLEGKDDLYVEFEMKTNPASHYTDELLKTYCDKLYQMVMKNKPAHSDYVFTSGDYRGLKYLKKTYPEVDLLMITGDGCNQKTIELCKSMGVKRIGAVMGKTTREGVQLAHREGLQVSLWPGLSFEDFMLGVYLGCDYMCTDVPQLVKKQAAEKASWVKVKY